MTEKALLQYLRQLDDHRLMLQAQQSRLETVEQLLAQLNPADRLIADRMLLHPVKNGSKLLTQLLDMEIATIYRHRKRILNTLLSALDVPSPQ